jgi:NhaP-type Na+/H+ or K+/H+ antiporter
MNELYVALVAVGALVLVLGLLSNLLKEAFFSAPMVALLAGVLLGPAGFGLLNPDNWPGTPDKILEEAARLTMAIAVMGVALRLPAGYFQTCWRTAGALLGIGMPLMWIASGLLAYWLLDVPFVVGLLVGAVVTPTDPVVATSIVTGKVAEANVPEEVRHALSAESGANDGLAYPVVMLPILLLTRPTGEAWSHWLTHSLLWSVGGGVLFGVLLGLFAGGLLKGAENKGIIERHSFLAYTLALSLLALGASKLLHIDGVLAVFAAGIAFDQTVSGKERSEEENVQEAVNQFFTLPIFILFGMMLPWDKWHALGWSAVLLVVAVLLLRRLPAFLALRKLVPAFATRKDAAYAGWFGPVGVAALLYATLAKTHTGAEIAWTAGSLIVFASLIAHGVTATPFTKLYGRLRRGSR